MKLLFFIDPVVYRQKPEIMGGWVIHWVLPIVRMTKHCDVEFAICANSWIVELAKASDNNENNIEYYPLSMTDSLRDIQFDRLSYMLDVADCNSITDENFNNSNLITRLRSIRDQFKPDVVVSFTENRYLREAFLGVRLLFCELSCLPRVGLDLFLFMDVFGHQTHSALNILSNDIENISLPVDVNEINSLLDRYFELHVRSDPRFALARDWLSSIAKGRRTILLALQPEDWPTYEGIFASVTNDLLIMRFAQSNPDCVVVPTTHPLFVMPASFRAALELELDNVRFPPDDLISQSEFLIHFADEMATISSNSAVCAILAGKVVRVLSPRSAFSRVAAISNDKIMRNQDASGFRARLIAFTCNAYSTSVGNLTEVPGHFDNIVRRLLSARDEGVYLDIGEDIIHKLRQCFKIEGELPEV